MKYRVVRKQEGYDECVVCGHKNPFSLQADFYELENNELVSKFHTMDEHQSYPGRTHGGLIGAILDETIGRCIKCYEPEAWGVTVEMNVKYKKPVPLNETLMCVGRITEIRSRMFRGTGELYLNNGEVAAIGEMVYVKMTPERITDVPLTEELYHLTPDAEPLEFVELYGDDPANVPFKVEKK